MLKLMLLKEVEGLGSAGEIVRVRPGFARNFLFPRRLAAPVSADALRQAEAHKRRVASEAAQRREEALAQASVLSNLSVSVEARAGEGGTLYGSVTAAMVAEAIVREGVAVDAKQVELAEPIKALGIYEVPLKLFTDVVGTVKLYVVEPPPESAS